MTVEVATQIAFERMPKEFNINQLIDQTRLIMERPHLFDSTILRRLRDLRRDFTVRYTVLDQTKGKYRKN